MLSTHSYTPFWLCAVQQWHRTTPALGAFLFCLLPPYRSTYQGKLSLLFALSKPLWPLAYQGRRRSSTLVTQSQGLSYDTLSASPVTWGAQRIWDWCLKVVASNFYILYSQQLCWRFVGKGQSCLSQCLDFFLFVLQLLWYTWCKNILFSHASFPPPAPFFLLHACLFVFSLVLVCMQLLELHNSISVFSPLWIAGAFEVYSIFVVADLPKYQTAQKLLFISLKWQPLRFEWADVNINVHWHPMFFLFVFWQSLKYLIHWEQWAVLFFIVLKMLVPFVCLLRHSACIVQYCTHSETLLWVCFGTLHLYYQFVRPSE